MSVLAALILLAIGCGVVAAGLSQRFPMYLRDGQMRFYEAWGADVNRDRGLLLTRIVLLIIGTGFCLMGALGLLDR